MVFLVRNHLFLEKKMVFEQPLFEKPSFSREKDGFWRSCPGKTIFFSRKRWFPEVLSWKNHLFLEKKMVFGGLLLVKPSFSREKNFSKGGCSKPSFSRKKWFRTKTPSFSRENQKTKKPKKNIFSKTMGLGPPKDGFFGFLEKKRWFFWFETIFFSRKRWFLISRSSKNHLFLEKKMVFGDLVLEKPSFSREKDGFWRSCPGKTIFFSRKRWFLEVLSW